MPRQLVSERLRGFVSSLALALALALALIARDQGPLGPLGSRGREGARASRTSFWRRSRGALAA